jgi:hypothetical protein
MVGSQCPDLAPDDPGVEGHQTIITAMRVCCSDGPSAPPRRWPAPDRAAKDVGDAHQRCRANHRPLRRSADEPADDDTGEDDDEAENHDVRMP